MPSPFPGMDPYLEDASLWRDVHQRLITYIADALQPQIMPHYVARIDERVQIGEPPRDVRSDVVVSGASRSSNGGSARAESSGGVAVAVSAVATAVEVDTPVLLPIPDEYREPFIAITDPRGRHVITVIEVLSPTNKTHAGEGYTQYARKRRELFRSEVNVVEIDLLRDGLPTVAAEADPVVTVPPHSYLVSVSRAARRHEYEVYPFTLRDRLPRVAVPLGAADADVALDLPSLFARCYDNGGFTAIVDYRTEPAPPLDAEQTTWADALLREKGLRPGEIER